MPDKIIKLLKIIKDYLWYNEERDNIVVVKEDDFIKNDLSIEDIKIGLETLIDKEIVENYHIRDRSRHYYPTSYEEKIKCIEDNTPLSGIFSKEVLGTPLYLIEIMDGNKLNKMLEEGLESKIGQNKKKVEFDVMNGVITCGKIQYKIHNDVRFSLMKVLWIDRKTFQIKKNAKGKEENIQIRKGMMWPKISTSDNIGKSKKEIREAIKGLNKIFRKKDLPLKIILANGIRLIVKE